MIDQPSLLKKERKLGIDLQTNQLKIVTHQEGEGTHQTKQSPHEKRRGAYTHTHTHKHTHTHTNAHTHKQTHTHAYTKCSHRNIEPNENICCPTYFKKMKASHHPQKKELSKLSTHG